MKRTDLRKKGVALLLALLMLISTGVTAFAATDDYYEHYVDESYKYVDTGYFDYIDYLSVSNDPGYYESDYYKPDTTALVAPIATTATKWDALFEAEWQAMGFTEAPEVFPGPGGPYGPLSGNWTAGNSGYADHPFALITNNADRADEDAFVIVLFGDGFTDSDYDQAKWRYYSQFFARNFFRIRPFNEFEDLIKIYRIDIASNDTGATRSDSPDGRNMPGVDPKDTYFGGFLWNQGMARLGGAANTARATNMARSYVPNNLAASRVILLNTNVYGGSGGATSFATLSWAFIDLVVHELAHTAGLHADEYLTGAAAMLANNRACPFLSPNLVHRDHLDNPYWQEFSPWYRLLGVNGTTLDPILEGTTQNADFENLFRPVNNCKMRFLGFSGMFDLTGEEEFPFCEPCVEQWRDRISILSNSPILHFQPYNDQFYDNEYMHLDNRHFILRLPQARQNPNYGPNANNVNNRVGLQVFGEQINEYDPVHGVLGTITMTVFEANNGIKGNPIPRLIDVPVDTPMMLESGTYMVEATFIGTYNGQPLTLELRSLENAFTVRPQIIVTAVGNYATPWLSTTGTGPRFRLDTLNRGWIANTPVTLPPLTIDPTRVGATNITEFDITYTWHIRNFDGTAGTVIASGIYTPGGMHYPGPSAVGQYMLTIRAVANATYTGSVPNFDVITEYPFDISVPFTPTPHFPINSGLFTHEAMANDMRAITIVGEGFTEAEQNEFEALAAEFITRFLATDPVKRAASRFTFFKVNGMSMDSGISREGSVPLDTYYGFRINNDGSIGTHRQDRPMDAILLQEAWRRDTNRLTWSQWGTTVVLMNADDVQANLHWRHPEYNRGVHLATIHDRDFTRLIESVVTQFAHVRSDRNPYLLDEYRWKEGPEQNRTFQETFERLVESSYSHEMWGAAGRPRPVVVSDAATRVYITDGYQVLNWDLPDTFGAYSFGHRLVTGTNAQNTFTFRYFTDDNHRVGTLLYNPPVEPGFYWAEAQLPASLMYFYGMHSNGTSTDRWGFTYDRDYPLRGRNMNPVETRQPSGLVRGFVRFEIRTLVTPEITIYNAPNGIVNTAYSFQFATTGYPVPTWSVVGNLPDGLNLSAQGLLTGTPTATGVFNFTVTASNSFGADNKQVTITITRQDTAGWGGGQGFAPAPLVAPTTEAEFEEYDEQFPLADWDDYAAMLHDLGLFRGVRNDADGNPIFALEDSLNRIQALVLTLRLLGLEDEVYAFEGDNPFEDVAGWQVPYVSYAYEHGITRGVSAVRFAPSDYVTFQQFTTFLLRALGYNDNGDGDFTFATALEKALEVGMYTRAVFDELNIEEFSRGNAVTAMMGALLTNVRGMQNTTLLDVLVADEVIESEAAEAFIEGLSQFRRLGVNEES